MNNQAKGEIKIADNLPGAEYANLAQIAHPNRDEFHLVFMNVSGQTGKVAAKIITGPGHYKRLVAAMQDNLKKYEERFGEIKDVPAPDKGGEIGFQA